MNKRACAKFEDGDFSGTRLGSLCGETSAGFWYIGTILILILIIILILQEARRGPFFSRCTLSTLSTCPLHTNGGCGKERRILIGPW